MSRVVGADRRHRGTQPGAGSTILRAPTLGIGIVLAINDVIVGEPLVDPIIDRMLDDLLGLDPIDWEDRLVTSRLRNERPATTGPPADQRSGPGSEDVIGSYFDPAYGYLNISSFGTASDLELEVSSDDLLQAYRELSPRLETPAYLGLMSNIYSRGLLLTHFDGPLYNATTIEVARKVGDNTAVPLLHGSYIAVLSQGEGIGMFGNFWTGETAREPVETDIKARAEVWFSEV